MKPKTLKTCLAAIAATTTIAALPALADMDTSPNYTTDNSNGWGGWMNSSDRYYRAHELSIDVFGTGTLGESDINHLTGDKIVHDGRLGAGGGVNLFFTKYIGIGGDVYTENWDRQLASGNLILRLPIPNTGLAPYIMGGGGYEWDDTHQGVGEIGGGLEYRFLKHVGVFVDGRYVFADKTDDFGLGRAGLRFSF